MLNHLKDKYESYNNLKKSFDNNVLTIGTWCQLNSPEIIEVLLYGNDYDWIVFDLEHGLIQEQDLPNLCRAAEVNRVAPFARLNSCSKSEIMRVMDSGCIGLIFPNVISSNQLTDMVNNSFWPPYGKRGVSFNRANLYGKEFENYLDFAAKPFVIAMIENQEGYNNLESILKTDLVDAILIGPYDLSASLGITGSFDNMIFIECIETIKNLCKSYNVTVGIHQVDPSIDLLKHNIDKGFKFIARSMDTVFISKSSRFNRGDIK
jgi:2-dehydro-3-deoxyglucarate aldolase